MRMAAAGSASPACRIAARCFAFRTAFGRGRLRRRRRSPTTTLELVFARADALDFFILGTGDAPWLMPEPLRLRFREAHISVDAMTTGPAVRTYNVMLLEGRRVGAGLIAID